MQRRHILLIACLLAAGIMIAGARQVWVRKALPRAIELVYGDGPQQAIDIYLPPIQKSRKCPVAVYFHPGGFVSGTRGDIPPYFVRQLLANGIAVASVGYRYASDANPMPAPIKDCHDAVCILRDNADSLNIDLQNMALVGVSAGATVAFNLAFHPEFSTPVKVVVALDAQATLDFNRFNRLIAGRLAQDANPARNPMFGLPSNFCNYAYVPDEWCARMRRYSPENLIQKNGVEVLLGYQFAEFPPKATERTMSELIHDPNFGKILMEACEREGVAATLCTGLGKALLDTATQWLIARMNPNL